jgi:uncharacterized protein GlcG (DUF336 family)
LLAAVPVCVRRVCRGCFRSRGGIPLITDDKIVGAVGVSGDRSDHDGMCAKAAAEALK